MAEEPEKLTGLVPEFYFELIARIIPGLVVIWTSMYWSGGDFKTVYSSLGLSAFLLVAAWGIGVTLDVGVYRVYRRILGNRCVPELRPRAAMMRKVPPWVRTNIFKEGAVVVFLRGMLVICVLTLGICLVMEHWRGLLSFLPVLPTLEQHHCRYGVLFLGLSVVFGLSWWTNRKSLEGTYRDWEQEIKAEEDARKAEEKARRAEERAVKALMVGIQP